MYNVEDILSRLQKGESVDSIANEMTEVLNKAVAEKKAQEEKEKIAAAAAEAQKRKVKYIKTVCDAFSAYIKEFHPDFIVDGIDLDDITDEDCDEIAKMIDTYIDLFKSFGNLIPLTKVETTAAPAKKSVTAQKKVLTEDELDSIFGNFFTKMKI